MDSTLVDFVKALRTAEIKVSPAETLDAMECLDLVGITDRNFLKDSLALVLSKTPEEKEAFDACFDRFFAFESFKQIGPDGEYTHDVDEGDAEAEGEQAEGEGSQGGSGEGQGGGAGGTSSR